MDTYDAIRALYADLVTARAGARDPRIRAAFAAVARENHLGPGPWQVFVPGGYVGTPSADPALIYQDILVGLDPANGVNNGEPTMHARCLDALAPNPGDRAVHIGCGTGYYTALLAELVGAEGTVEAFEIDERLARLAAGNLADRANVAVHHRSGAAPPLPSCDVLYVSAGATRPLDAWLDALAPAGRLLFPLVPRSAWGAVLLVTRPAAGDTGATDRFAARFVSPAAFIPCIGAQDPAENARLAEAFARGGTDQVRALHRGPTVGDDGCWYAGAGWWLSKTAL